MALPYIPTTWLSGDIVSSARLNKLEGGVKENSDAILENTADVNQLKSQISEVESGFPQKSAQGAIVTIDDGADNVPVVSLTAQIDPVQDLHGYDNPWPAGGGKNLLHTTGTSKTEAGVTWTVNADGSITVSGSATGYTDFTVGKADVTGLTGVVTISANDLSHNVVFGGIYLRDANDDLLATIYSGGGQTVHSIDLTSYPTASYIILSLKRSNNATVSGTIKIQVEKGSSATSWVPFENLCPISGFTEVDVSVTGVNLFDKSTITDNKMLDDATGELANNDSCFVSDYIGVKAGVTYHIPARGTSRSCVYNAAKEFLHTLSNASGAQAWTSDVDGYIRITVNADTSVTNADNCQVSIGSSAADYHAYNGSVTPISLGQTVYGGTVAATNGRVTDTDKMVDLGALNWVRSSAGYFAAQCSDAYINNSAITAICSSYEMISGSQFGSILSGSKPYACVSTYHSGTYEILVFDPKYSTVDDFKAAVDGVQLCYKLDVPIVIEIDPVQIKTLYGLNNIWADTGDIDLTYRCDPATFTSEQIRIMLNAMVAPVEASTTASKAYSVNDFLIMNNVLYKVISPIANGGTITPNTNVSATTVGEQLTAILNA